MPLPMTDHPLHSNEFHAIYARSVFDVMREEHRVLSITTARAFALAVQRKAIERSLIEIGYFLANDRWWYFRQQGFEARLPIEWVKLPVESFAEKIAGAGVNMLNERCRLPDVEKVERI